MATPAIAGIAGSVMVLKITRTRRMMVTSTRVNPRSDATFGDNRRCATFVETISLGFVRATSLVSS